MRALAIGANERGDLRQTDTYFNVPGGRLKLREIDGRHGELTFYKRDEEGVDRASDYEVFRTPEAAVLRDLLGTALGVIAVVKKRRTLLVLDGSRIHLSSLKLVAPIGTG